MSKSHVYSKNIYCTSYSEFVYKYFTRILYVLI